MITIYNNIIIQTFKDIISSTNKVVGNKPTRLFTKSIKGKNIPKDKIYNSVLGTTHTLIPDILGIDGLCHFFQTLTTTCPCCGENERNREMWGTEDYAIMYCKKCKVYIWKSHVSNIEQAHKDTNYTKITYLRDWQRKHFKWKNPIKSGR